MYRILIILTLIGLVTVACTNQGGGATESPGAVSTPVSSPTDDSGSTGTTASTECSESFGPIAEAEVTSISDLGDLPEEVQGTMQSCESVDEWIAGAQELFDDEINPNTVRLLLDMQCGSPALANTDICRELASS